MMTPCNVSRLALARVAYGALLTLRGRNRPIALGPLARHRHRFGAEDPRKMRPSRVATSSDDQAPTMSRTVCPGDGTVR